MPVIGYLYFGRSEPHPRSVTAFRQGLADAGYFEGRNVERRFLMGTIEIQER
jgi:hypothetical protein